MSSENIDTLISSNQLSIIDLSKFDLRPGKEDSSKAIALELRNTIYNKGLAILINHGISQNKIQKAWNSFDKFLQLPEEIRNKYNRTPDCTTGYLPPGKEILDNEKRSELRHSYNMCERIGEKLPTEFYNDIVELLEEYKCLTFILLESIALALDMPKNFFTEKHKKMLTDQFENFTTFRLLYYPPVTCEEQNSENYIRCGAHKDYGTFTLLSQDTEGGLEIKLPGKEEWERVGYLPESIIMNCGELFELWTNNRYPAVKHRVVIPKENEKSTKDRHALAFFVHPDNEIMICPKDIPIPGLKSQTVNGNEKILTALEHMQLHVDKSLVFY